MRPDYLFKTITSYPININSIFVSFDKKNLLKLN